MATYVLVPGAWLGGWVWLAVARELRGRGHEVYPATLTGLGERVHLARPEVDLEMHIQDVVNLIEYEGLDGVTLLGHSYAGMVVTGVADRVANRLERLIYLDTAPFEDGEALIDFYPPEGRAWVERLVAEQGDGWRFPLPPLKQLGMSSSLAGLGEAERALLVRKATSQPFATLTQPLRLTRTEPGRYQRVVIACDDVRKLLALGIPRIQALREPPWQMRELPTGHWPMLSMPGELATLLHELTVRA
jgi:pimeloyl-ACP methyl ester carboxylesterase